MLYEWMRVGDNAPVSNRHCELRWTTKQRNRNATDSIGTGAIKRPANEAHKGAVHMLGIKTAIHQPALHRRKVDFVLAEAE
jgi:hypothetical protein